MASDKMARKMVAILINPDHPVTRMVNARLPSDNGEPLDQVLPQGISVLRNYSGYLTKAMIYSDIFGCGQLPVS